MTEPTDRPLTKEEVRANINACVKILKTAITAARDQGIDKSSLATALGIVAGDVFGVLMSCCDEHFEAKLAIFKAHVEKCARASKLEFTEYLENVVADVVEASPKPSTPGSDRVH
jgi:hypothetical protein